MSMKYTTTQLVEALRYCVNAQRATSGEACSKCKAAALFGCDPLKACSKLNEVAADYIEAMEADLHRRIEPCDICAHRDDTPDCDLECTKCQERCVCFDCSDDNDKMEYRGPRKEEHNADAEAND